MPHFPIFDFFKAIPRMFLKTRSTRKKCYFWTNHCFAKKNFVYDFQKIKSYIFKKHTLVIDFPKIMKENRYNYQQKGFASKNKQLKFANMSQIIRKYVGYIRSNALLYIGKMLFLNDVKKRIKKQSYLLDTFSV